MTRKQVLSKSIIVSISQYKRIFRATSSKRNQIEIVMYNADGRIMLNAQMMTYRIRTQSDTFSEFRTQQKFHPHAYDYNIEGRLDTHTHDHYLIDVGATGILYSYLPNRLYLHITKSYMSHA